MIKIGDIYGTDGKPNCVILYNLYDDEGYPPAAASVYECYELGKYGLGTERLGSIEEEWTKMSNGAEIGETLFVQMDTPLLELIIVQHAILLRGNINLRQGLFEILKNKYRDN